MFFKTCVNSKKKKNDTSPILSQVYPTYLSKKWWLTWMKTFYTVDLLDVIQYPVVKQNFSKPRVSVNSF